MLGGLSLQLGFACVLLAQGYREKPCALVESSERAEAADAKVFSSWRLTAARLNGSRFLKFLTNPATSYRERMAAAYQVGQLISPKDLPELWAVLAAHDGVWVQASPCEWVHAAAPRGAGSGLPAYPVTADDRAKAPWQWQVSRALQAVNREAQQYYSDPGRYKQMTAEAWQ